MTMAPRRPGPAPVIRLAALAWLAAADAAPAESIAVRSGEHDGFSRLVVAAGAGTGWALGRDGDRYTLRLERPDAAFDTSKAFDLIPRTRIADLGAEGGGGELRLTLACDCHASAFGIAGGLVVIDVADGPAPPDAGFERPLPPRIADAPPAKPVAATPPLRAALPGITFSDPYFPSLWATAGDRAPTPPPAGPPPAGPPARHGPAGRTSAPSSAEIPREAPAAAEAAPEATASGPVTQPPLPDPRILAAESALLLQLGRAATQGLVVARLPDAQAAAVPPEPPAGAMHGAAAAPSSGASAARTTAADGAGDGSLAIAAATSIDRAVAPGGSDTGVTPDGAACPPGEEFALADWGDDRPAALQIADARLSLVGEFDRPDPPAIVALARLYLRFGLGSEARAALDAFGIPDRDAPWLRDLAAIVDGDAPAPDSRLAALAGCENPASLWALLAQADSPRLDDARSRAVLRAFSALPLALRRDLGGRLADIFLAGGKPDLAHAVAAAIARSPDAEPADTGLLDARVKEAAGRIADADAAYSRVIADDPANAPQAVADLMRLRLKNGTAIEPALAEAAGAFAFEREDTALGRELSGLHILGLAAAGDFATAAGLLRAGDEGDAHGAAAIPPDTGIAFLRIAAAGADDAAFAAIFFEARDRGLTGSQTGSLTGDDRLAVAGRLLAIGLPQPAGALLAGAGPAGADPADPAGRLLDARIALAAADPSRAASLLADADGPEAAALRAEALSRMNEHSAAAAALAAAGDSAGSAREAWRAGDLAAAGAGVAASAPELSRALDRLAANRAESGPDAAVPPPGGPGGPRARPPSGQASGQPSASPAAAGTPASGTASAGAVAEGAVADADALLADSAATRAAIVVLLDSYPAPDASPDASAAAPPASAGPAAAGG